MTPFGMFLRTVRLERGLLLKDMADQLDVTSAYLSALEHGKKGAPGSTFLQRIDQAFELDPKRRAELRDAVRDSATTVSIPTKVTPRVFQTAHAFARKLPSLSEKQLQQIDRILDGDPKP